MQMNKMMQERFGASGHPDHHRKLQVAVAETIGEAAASRYAEKGAKYASKTVVAVLKKVDPLMWRIVKMWNDMNDYDKVNGSIKEAEAATDSEFTQENLHEADEMKVQA